MSLEEDILIENYLKGNLSESEKKLFLERMSNDYSFKGKVLLEKQLFETLDAQNWSFIEKNNTKEIESIEEFFKNDDIKKIKKSISVAQNEYKRSQKNNKKLIYLAVASIALLISVYSLFLTSNKSPTSNELYAEYIKTNELYSSVSRGETDLHNDLIVAENYFRERKYSQALPILKNQLSFNKDNATLYIYTAISQIELNEFEQAESTLNSLIKSDLIDAQKGYWYKSLLYLKSNQLAKAKSELQLIIKNSYFKNKEAQEILDELN